MTTSSQTITAATTSSEGLAEAPRRQLPDDDVSYRTIPRIEESTSSDGDSGGGSSFGGGSRAAAEQAAAGELTPIEVPWCHSEELIAAQLAGRERPAYYFAGRAAQLFEVWPRH